jgi:hypothetical protein
MDTATEHDILPRHRTPPSTFPDGSQSITVQRCCNGCGGTLGDVTMAEIECAIDGRPLPDVRMECPRCRPGMEPPLAVKVRDTIGSSDG